MLSAIVGCDDDQFRCPNILQAGMHPFSFLATLHCLLVLCRAQGVVEPSNYSIGILNPYFFGLQETTFQASLGSTLVIEFPSEYSASDLKASSPFSIDQANSLCPVNCDSVTVSYSGMAITLSGMFPSNSNPFFQIFIRQIPNPLVALTSGSFTIRIFDSSSVQTYTTNLGGLTFTPKIVACSAAVGQFKVVNSITSASFQIMPQNNPSRNPLDRILVTISEPWEKEDVVRSSLTSNIHCTSTSQPHIHCSKARSSVTIFDVQFANLIEFSIHDIYVPSMVLSAGSVEISTMTGSSQKIDTCSTRISGLEQDFLRKAGVAIQYPDDQFLKVTITVAFPRQVTSSIITNVDVPAQLPLSGSTIRVFRNGLLLTPSPATFTPANNRIRVVPFAELASQSVLTVECTRVARPRGALFLANTSISAFKLIQGVEYPMASATCCQQQLEPRSSLAASVAASSPQFLRAGVTYTFTLNISSLVSLETTDQILIYFPYQYELPVGSTPCSISTSPSDSSTITTSPMCQASSIGSSPTTPLVRISSFLQQAQALGSAVKLVIALSSLTNPSSNPSTDPFVVSLMTSSGSIIEKQNRLFVSLSPAIIAVMTVTPSSLVVYKQDVSYTIEFPISGDLRVGYQVEVKFPTEVIVHQGSLSCRMSFSRGASVISGNPCELRTADNTVVLRVGTLIGLLGSPVSLQVDGLTNPKSLGAVSGFDLKILDSLGDILEQLATSVSSALNVAMTIRSEFQRCSLSMPSTQFGSTSTLKILCIAPFGLSTTHSLSLQYDASVLLVNQPTRASSCSAPTQCSFSSGTVLASSNIVGANGLQLVSISVSNCMILGPIAASSPFVLTLGSGNGQESLRSSVGTIESTEAGGIEYTVSQTSWVMGEQSVSITIGFSIPVILRPSVSYLQVHIPSQYTTTHASNIFNLTSTIVIASGELTVPGVTNPSNSLGYSSEYFFLVAYDSRNNILALSSDSLTRFQVICHLPCRTCLTSPSNCVSCYSAPIEPTYTLFFTNASSSQGVCLDHCPPKFYRGPASTCLACNSNCLTCSETRSTFCLTCPASHYLHDSVDHKCYPDCPVGYYEDPSLRCRPCPSNCLTCTSLTTCTSCSSSYYLHLTDGKCLENCPPKTYILASPRRCLVCRDRNCLSCNRMSCLACSSPYFLLNGECTSSCPSPLLPDLGGNCSPCSCRSCSEKSYVCTSCLPSSPFLYSSRCYSACPEGTYPNSDSNCLDCPGNCLSCPSAATCSFCAEGFLLLANASGCVTVCPSGQANILSAASNAGSCQTCLTGCSSCQVSVSFCLTCSAGYLLHQNTCVQNCPAPLHAVGSSCKECADSCETCLQTNPNNCTQCHPGYFLQASSCLTACHQATYPNPSLKQCNPCHSLCTKCTNATNCTACVDGFFLLDWFCYATCPTTPVLYYSFEGQCVTCMPQCTSCLDSPVKCTSCSRSEYIFNQFTFECAFICKEPYFLNGSACALCSSQCLTCDRAFDICASCGPPLFLFNGTCVSECPFGYFSDQSPRECLKCDYPCRDCIEGQCLECQKFAYIYKATCVVDCPEDRPYEARGYCTDCVGVGFCAVCSSEEHTAAEVCTECVYPYLLFDGRCLNECPENYTTLTSAGASGGSLSRSCAPSNSYLSYLQERKLLERPILPPGCFIGAFLLVGLVLFVVSRQVYAYTYHTGYLLALLVFIDALLAYYSLYFIRTRYLGEYNSLWPNLPLYLVLASLGLNHIILTLLYAMMVLKLEYLKDVRYEEWRSGWPNPAYWWVLTLVLMPGLGGHRLHKLHYSKLLGRDIFSFRITSVSKFYREDLLTLLTIVGDLLFLAALALCVFNVFITYNGFITLAYEALLIKTILWLLTFHDLKKPDRGFFKGDEAQAEEDILREEEEEHKKLQRIDTNDLVKLIRTKSAGQLAISKLYQHLHVEDFKSVYNPDNYEEVPKVPNRKIEKNIYKGNFRKGKKVTIQQKLKKFIDEIKPVKAPGKKMEIYLKDLIYWKPPKVMRVAPKVVPQSQQSMLALLNQKEIEYKEELEQVEQIEERKLGYYVRPRYNQQNFLEDIDETIPNETVEFFYPSNSLESGHHKESLDFDDLLNVNYARKKHLSKGDRIPGPGRDREESIRNLHHEPRKKRNPHLRGYEEITIKKSDY